MTLAHVNKSYLESNLMAAPPSSRLDSLYADLQVHALSVSDGLSKVQASLGTDSLTTVMGRIDIDLSSAIRQQSTVSWLQTDATLKALLPKEDENKAQHDTAFECIAALVLKACELHQVTVIKQAMKVYDTSISKPLTLVIEKANRDLTATQSTASDVIFEAKSVAGTTSAASKVLLDTFRSNVAFTVARALELKSFKTRDGQFAMRIAELSSDTSIDIDDLSSKTHPLVSAQKTIAIQRHSVINMIKDHYGQHAGASADGDQLVIPENLEKGKGKALVEAFETYLRSRISQFWPILPFLNRIISDFDTSKKTFYKPPCIINDKAGIPAEFRDLYIDASKFLFSEIKLALNSMPNVMARLRSSFIYGEDNTMGLCVENDGPMALFSLICHYRVSSNDNEETLRTYFENMYKRLDRDVRSTLDKARKKLLEASELKIDMKWTTTGKKIYDRLAHNNHNMATPLAIYKDMTPSDNQTCGLFDQMFAKIDNQIKLDEKQDDSSNKYTNSAFGRVTCRDGANCTRYGCTWSHPKEYVAPTGGGKGVGKGKGKGKGKSKGKGKGSKETWKCQVPGCSDPQVLSGYRKLCTTHFKDVGSKGPDAKIKLKDGTIFTLNKSEYKKANSASAKKRTTPRGRITHSALSNSIF